jgi:hypothetical protein
MPDYLVNELESVLLLNFLLADEADWGASLENEGDLLVSAVKYKKFDENTGYGQLVHDFLFQMRLKAQD